MRLIRLLFQIRRIRLGVLCIRASARFALIGKYLIEV
jgi:hypothetical protein